MHYAELAESVKHFKEKEGGREEMSEIVERYINERVEERVKECVEKEKTISVQKSHEQHEMDVRPGT